MSVETRRKARYPRKLSEYARLYRRSIPTMKAWVRKGKLAGRLPPLATPGEFPAWYEEHVGPVPDDLLSLCATSAATNGQSNDEGKAQQQRDFSGVKSLSIEQNVEALRVTLAINKKLLDEALTDGPEGVVAQRQRNYERCFNLLRLAEGTLIEVQKKRGQLIDKEKIIDDQMKVVDTLKQMRVHMARDILIELEKNCGRRLFRIFNSQRAALEAAIEKVRIGEELLFSRGLKEL
jgi:hypothetical protein